METIFAKNFARNHEKKNNTWNISSLVDESFVPANQHASVLYCRLTDFWRCYLVHRDKEQIRGKHTMHSWEKCQKVSVKMQFSIQGPSSNFTSG